MMGSSSLDGKDGGTRMGRSERVRPRVTGVASLIEARGVSLVSDRACVVEFFPSPPATASSSTLGIDDDDDEEFRE